MLDVLMTPGYDSENRWHARHSWGMTAKIVFEGQTYSGFDDCEVCYGETGKQASELASLPEDAGVGWGHGSEFIPRVRELIYWGLESLPPTHPWFRVMAPGILAAFTHLPENKLARSRKLAGLAQIYGMGNTSHKSHPVSLSGVSPNALSRRTTPPTPPLLNFIPCTAFNALPGVARAQPWRRYGSQ